MRRFLVVGCGGSGGATLSYMMDQLRSDLAAQGVDHLPAGWQFVHIDVPTGSEGGPEGLSSVEGQGGTYFGSGLQGAKFAMLDAAVSQRLAASGALGSTATWAPRHPDLVNTPISVGAGQYRAVGRMITLNRAADILDRLTSCWADLNHSSARTEMMTLDVPGMGSFNPDDAPIVVVVSSMAGGAGASMALDICRVLTLVEGVDPALMGVFMVTPDIFDSLDSSARTGVRANALAMLGEIVASQTGAARHHDVRTLSALGLSNGAGAVIPFARVFPVGRKVGAEGAIFGDGSPNAVYRGIARGLAGLMMSERASEQFVRYDLGNTGSPNGNLNYLGWGSADWDPLPWGSFGFASLSMGRDRYAEYSAQRLARSGVDKLLRGHLQQGNSASSVEQATALLDSQWPNILAALGLPSGAPGGPTVGQWLASVAMDRSAAEKMVSTVIDTHLRPYLPAPAGMTATQWIPMLRHAAQTRRDAMNQGVQAAAYHWAFTWHQELADRCVAATADAVAAVGLPYATAMLERLRTHLTDVVMPAAGDLTAHGDGDISAIPRDIEPTLGMLKKSIPNGQQILDRMLGLYPAGVRMHLLARAAGHVSSASGALATEVLTPLIAALGETQRLLEIATSEQVRDLGLARLATSQYAAWPSDSDERVHARFAEANNEVLLTGSSQFKDQYELLDLPRSVSDNATMPSLGDAVRTAARQVIAGLWKTTGGERPPGGLIEQTALWRSRAFTVDPMTGDARQPSLAQFDVHCRPGELLDRARKFIGRPGESFAEFVDVSLREYVQGSGAPESELAARRAATAVKFAEALSLARPLTMISEEALGAVHSGESLAYRYKFSSVPFEHDSVGDEVTRILESSRYDKATRDNLAQSMSDEAGIKKIDIFGSYPNYSPLAFSSVLKPIAEQWAQTSEEGRESFWRYRRARPLEAALPMTEVERHAMAAGWFLGQIIGEISIPDAPYDQPVKIWDPTARRWQNFPNPLLTPPRRFLATYDWLPAVMEGILIAFAQSHQSPAMSSLRPYQILREIFDDSNGKPSSTTMIELSAVKNLSTWLRSGESRSGLASRVGAANEATTIAERAEAITAWLNSILVLARDNFVEEGVHGSAGAGQFARINSRELASLTPIFRDLAADVLWSTEKLISIAVRAAELAERAETTVPVIGMDAQGASTVALPDGGTF